MSYIPIDFKNLPIKETPLDADNLNYMQQGIVLAVNRSRVLDEAWKDGSLDGKDGKDGSNGIQGPPGPSGRSFEIDGFAERLADLPPPSIDLKNQIWVTYEFGHLHFCDGIVWLDWGQFVGVQGPEGPQGIPGEKGVFDIDAITPTQAGQLHAKLTPLNNDQQWKYKTFIASGQTANIDIADLNLTLRINRNSATVINYRFIPIDTAKPATYYIKRLSNYDLVAWESSVTTGWIAQPVPASGFVLDASGYLPGREHTNIEVIDPNTQIWYSIQTIGLGEGTVFVDVVKRATQSRQVVIAT